MWCKIIDGNYSLSNPIYLGTIYRFSTCSFDNLVSWCSSLHNTLFSGSALPKIIINGNFNLPYFNWSVPSVILFEPSHSNFLSFLHEHRLLQLNLQPTLKHNIPDLLITNIPDSINNFLLKPPFSSSDHDSFSFSISDFLSEPQQQFHNTVVFYIDRADYQSIRTHLNSINWVNLLNTCSDINSV